MNKTYEFTNRCFMFDMARQYTFDRDEMLCLVDILQKSGYNSLGLYLEGAMVFDSMPGNIRRGIMTKSDVRWLKAECAARGILLFPFTNIVAHMEHFTLQERFAPLLDENKITQIDFTLPGAEEFVMGILDEYIEAFDTKIINIGADEPKLSPEKEPLYADFIDRICRRLLDRGITPMICGDYLYGRPALCERIDKRVVLEDWFYSGHRKESLRFFKDAGFTEIYATACEHCWTGYISYQPYDDGGIPIKPDEVEAFFTDAAELDLHNACLSSWELQLGANIWANLYPVVRAGLYLTNRPFDDDAVEEILFGRKTPYTAVTHLLQDEMPFDGFDYDWFVSARFALYDHPTFRHVMCRAAKEMPTFTRHFEELADKAEAMLADWVPASETENRALTAMNAVIAVLRAQNALVEAGKTAAVYAAAAKLQFTAPAVSRQMLCRVSGAFRLAAEKTAAYRRIHAIAIEHSGHTENDLGVLSSIEATLRQIADKVDYAGDNIDIPYVRFLTLIGA